MPGMMNAVMFDVSFIARKEIEWGSTMESQEEQGVEGRGLLYPHAAV